MIIQKCKLVYEYSIENRSNYALWAWHTLDILGDPFKCILKGMKSFPISMIWKSDHLSLHNALISKTDQNTEQIWNFFKLRSGLTIWKCPYKYKYQMNGLAPNIIHHINASELWNAFLSNICDFDNHVWFCRHLKRSNKGHQNGIFYVTFDLFWDDPIAHGYKITITHWR